MGMRTDREAPSPFDRCRRARRRIVTAAAATTLAATALIVGPGSAPSSAASEPMPLPTGELVSWDGAASTGAAVRNDFGRLEVFGVDAAGNVTISFQYLWGGTGTWVGPFALTMGGLHAVGSVSSQRDGGGLIALAVRGADGGIHVTTNPADRLGFEPFARVGDTTTTFSTDPALARNDDGRLEVFAVGVDGTLRHSWQSSSGSDFGPWYAIGGPVFSTRPGDGVGVGIQGSTLYAMGTGANSDLLRTWFDGTTWPVPTAVATGAAGRPALRSYSLFVIVPDMTRFFFDGSEAFYRGIDHRLHRWQGTRSGDTVSTNDALLDADTPITGSPVLGINSGGLTEVFVSDGTQIQHLYGKYPVAYSELYPMGGSCPGQPSVARNLDTRLEVFCVGAGGDLQNDWQVAPQGAWYGSSSLGGHLVP